ncbi:acyltransferase family protein [Pseudomonas nunensis]|uniref:Acyltransferase n=1 Tax=Pseudomonas nunensis TaxID=2961896 RepID=A0ABY5EAU6_9PSED|nr:acyltransferase [Pseudomonas nunensis]MCL5229718.1 acyltransferase [Pseudomonas nunensis]UTO11795.1 acyltransferase [Pseudomonas nunensis]
MKPLKEKNIDIQILRAIAIIAVIIQHINGRLPTPQSYSELFKYALFWTGVDIFFAISGYLICKTFYRDIEISPTKYEAISSFWRRRVSRLFPAVLAWVSISVFISLFTTSYPNSDSLLIAKSAITGLLGFSNIYWASCVQFSLQCGSADYNAVTWSLSLEWQLYALSTILIALLGFKRGILILAITALVFSILPAPSFSFPWVLRPQAFAIGAIIYIATKNSGVSVSAPISISMLLVGLLICFLAPLHIPQPYLIPTISLGAGICLFSSLSGRALAALLPSKLLTWIGERSYSIYLCHLPLILFTREISIRLNFNEPTYLNFSISLAIAVFLIAVMSDLSYRFIEIPFQNKLLKSTDKKSNDLIQS